MDRQGKECAVIDARPGKVKLIGAHIIRRSIAKADGSAAGIVSAVFLFLLSLSELELFAASV
jgi:hypothetical protein